MNLFQFINARPIVSIILTSMIGGIIVGTVKAIKGKSLAQL